MTDHPLIVLAMYAAVWAVGSGTFVTWGSGLAKASSYVISHVTSITTSVANIIPGRVMTVAETDYVTESILKYIDSILLFHLYVHKSYFMCMWDGLVTYHPYFSSFFSTATFVWRLLLGKNKSEVAAATSPSNSSCSSTNSSTSSSNVSTSSSNASTSSTLAREKYLPGIRTSMELFTIQSLLFLFIFILFDMQSPIKDAVGCQAFLTESTCVEQRTLLDSKQTLCRWHTNTLNGTNFVASGNGECLYQEYSFSWGVLLTIGVISSIACSIAMWPVHVSFKFITSTVRISSEKSETEDAKEKKSIYSIYFGRPLSSPSSSVRPGDFTSHSSPPKIRERPHGSPFSSSNTPFSTPSTRFRHDDLPFLSPFSAPSRSHASPFSSPSASRVHPDVGSTITQEPSKSRLPTQSANKVHPCSSVGKENSCEKDSRKKDTKKKVFPNRLSAFRYALETHGNLIKLLEDRFDHWQALLDVSIRSDNNENVCVVQRASPTGDDTAALPVREATQGNACLSASVGDTRVPMIATEESKDEALVNLQGFPLLSPVRIEVNNASNAILSTLVLAQRQFHQDELFDYDNLWGIDTPSEVNNRI